ncbi:starch synthase [Sphingomonas sp. BE138]|uniref:glycogen synthase n=1 Tax=Sphingomonas sp. BE138 TaxID=2817845 RepID=UPI00285AC612|nr:glycogen/starch synthase [Sphingomonas sp. BE138]MDR6790632.1 starch synthase [Sphingomonas sp. BE138]
MSKLVPAIDPMVGAVRPRVLIVTAELSPIVKTGGLGDMVRAIANSLSSRGFDVSVLLPGYRSVVRTFDGKVESQYAIMTFGYPVSLEEHRYEGLRIIVARSDSLFNRSGDPYRSDQGIEWPDMAKRFAVLGNVAANIANGSTSFDPPEILHLHDWHTALTPAWLEERCRARTVLTVHNFMFQGRISVNDAKSIGLNERYLKIGQLFGGVSFLQVGLHLADKIVTVSKGYETEIKKRGRFNWWYISDPLDAARLDAVPNWPDLNAWSPAKDLSVPARFDHNSVERRSINKQELESRLGWTSSSDAILCTVSRITKPKGFSFLIRRMESILERECRILIVGDGDPKLLNGFRSFAARFPDRVAIITPYNEDSARLVLAGSDILLMPSLTEPSGLSQQQAQLYGCVPIVSNAGGLPDTVEDGVTGFLFTSSNPTSFLSALDRALAVRLSGDWITIQRAAMRRHKDRTENEGYARMFNKLLSNRFSPS